MPVPSAHDAATATDPLPRRERTTPTDPPPRRERTTPTDPPPRRKRTTPTDPLPCRTQTGTRSHQRPIPSPGPARHPREGRSPT
ncbi:hypothetical protein DMP23_15950 [Amycolatopsis sp. A1MSW2902]